MSRLKPFSLVPKQTLLNVTTLSSNSRRLKENWLKHLEKTIDLVEVIQITMKHLNLPLMISTLIRCSKAQRQGILKTNRIKLQLLVILMVIELQRGC
jgi:uncharacterized membrane protein